MVLKLFYVPLATRVQKGGGWVSHIVPSANEEHGHTSVLVFKDPHSTRVWSSATEANQIHL